jgi:hypothetical protein
LPDPIGGAAIPLVNRAKPWLPSCLAPAASDGLL